MRNLIKGLLREAGYYGHVLTRKLPKELDNRLYTMIHVIGGINSRDVIKFADRATPEQISLLFDKVREFPSTQRDVYRYAGSYRMLLDSPEYQEIVNLVKHTRNGITEETNPYLERYIPLNIRKRLFDHWSELGYADWDSLTLFGIDMDGASDGAFTNVADVVYPLLRIEWEGGIEGTPMYKNKDKWSRFNPHGSEGYYNDLNTDIIYRSEPTSYDFMFDESESFGEHGYSCWDLNVYIKKSSISFDGGPIQDMFDVDGDTEEIIDIANSGNNSDGDELLWGLVNEGASDDFDKTYKSYFSMYCKMNVFFV